MIGRTISHYRILEKLGEGGMGVVYKAEDTKLKRTVALKFLPREALTSQEAKARLLHEAQAAAALDHPGICTVHEIDEAEGQTFIAMAHIEGQSLRERIASGPLALTDVLEIAIQTAEGLHDAHENGIVHRDIKPSNVMISSGGQVRIMDFGLARSAEQTQLTQAGTTLGTVAYMSPEQARGEMVNHRTDIWSLGVMLYEMITGQLPFKGDHEQAVMYSVLNEPPEPITGLRSGIPLELERVITRAMAKDPNERYQHLDEMLVDLRSLQKFSQGGTTSLPVAPSASSHAARPRTTRPMILVTLIAVVLVAVVLILTKPWERGSNVDPNRVVVAPLENRTGDPSLDLVGQMAADWITQGLSRLDGIKVVPTMSAIEYARDAGTEAGRKQETDQLRTLAKLTGAGIVISGVYYADGENLQFQTQVTDVEQGELIQALPAIRGPRDAPMESIEALRQQVMAAVALHVSEAHVTGKGSPPPAYAAYREYMLGMELFGSDYPQAIRHFELAAELDSSFLPPRVFMIYSYSNQGRRAEADSIYRIVDSNRGNLTSYERLYLDFLGALLRRDHAESMRLLRRLEVQSPYRGSIRYLIARVALKLNRPREAEQVMSEFRRWHDERREPIGSRGYHTWGFFVWADALHMQKKHSEELDIIRWAVEFFPDSEYFRISELAALVALGKLDEVNIVLDECMTLSDSREFQCDIVSEVACELRAHDHWDASPILRNRANQLYEEFIREDSVSEADRYFVADMLYSVEYWEEASALFEGLASDNPDDIDYMGHLGCLAARRGDRDEAVRISERLRRSKEPYLFGENTYWCACIAAQLGEPERAMELLREAFAQGYQYSAELHRDMDLQPLWDYPPFVELIKPKG
ncbi:protein kinase [Candidatus Eisenbacteria bacterium]|uniref:Protein kinase n=1 Tax=Eiseniibacteriota bacterium TaxID=2212470 RepID=A0ABV6YM83_UNCEI